MKLYYKTGACSLATRIVLEEVGASYQSEKVDLKTKKTDSGKDYKQINPKGSVPALELDNKEVLTEGAVIMQYIADQYPDKKLVPKNGTFERYRLQEWLNFIATDLHKGFSPLFNVAYNEDVKKEFRKNLTPKFDFLAERINGKTFVMGGQFTIADAYLFTILSWSEHVGIDLTKWPKIMGYYETIHNRPAVQTALKNDGMPTNKKKSA
jgi:glutathione S-transferase